MTLVARMVLAAGLVGAVSCASLAQDTKPVDPAKVEADRKAAADAAKMAMEAAEKAKQEAAAAAQKQAAAAQPAAPKGLEVPSLPIVKKTELEGGLIIEDMKIGEGYEVKEGGAVVAHYHGTLKDGGKTFDSSFERGEPIAFPLILLALGDIGNRADHAQCTPARIACHHLPTIQEPPILTTFCAQAYLPDFHGG